MADFAEEAGLDFDSALGTIPPDSLSIDERYSVM